MSNSGPSASATRLVKSASRLTPRLYITGLDDGGMTGGGLDLGLIGVGQTGRADHVHDARLRRERGEGDGRDWRGEVEHAVDASEYRKRLVGDGDAERLDPRHLADVAADCRRHLDLDPAGDRAARGRSNDSGQRLAHAPASPKHGKSHVVHCLCPPGDGVGALAMIERPRVTEAIFYDANAPAHKPREAKR